MISVCHGPIGDARLTIDEAASSITTFLWEGNGNGSDCEKDLPIDSPGAGVCGVPERAATPFSGEPPGAVEDAEVGAAYVCNYKQASR